jgi:hypothetical protein
VDDNIVSAIVGGVVALVGKESLTWLVHSVIERSNLARDGLVDIATMVRSAERTANLIEKAKAPSSYADLVDHPSRWIQGRPVLPATSYATGFGNETVHVHAILMFDALDWFDRRAAQHKEAFVWLLEKCDPEMENAPKWSGSACSERLGVLRDAKQLMRTHALDAARHGYYIIEAMWSLTQTLPPFWRNEESAVENAKRVLGIESADDARKKARKLDQLLASTLA